MDLRVKTKKELIGVLVAKGYSKSDFSVSQSDGRLYARLNVERSFKGSFSVPVTGVGSFTQYTYQSAEGDSTEGKAAGLAAALRVTEFAKVCRELGATGHEQFIAPVAAIKSVEC